MLGSLNPTAEVPVLETPRLKLRGHRLNDFTHCAAMWADPQVTQYIASRIILPYRPRAVVLYAGENDLSWPSSKSPEQVFGDFQQFVEIVHSQLPETWIYYVSIKPTILRRKNWAKMQRANELIGDFIRTQPRTQFIDVSAAMLDAQGQPRAELFRWDGLHMNPSGYAIWTSIIKPVLLSRFGGGT